MATDWEQTFRSWSKPSSDSECEKQENAERMIGDAIRAYEPLKQRDIKIIPQGSYRNNTNVRQESDVDICVCCMNPFFPDYSVAEYGASDAGNVSVAYTFAQLKSEVESALVAKFGRAGVTRGDKAFDVHPTSYRVDADVVPAFAYRLYFKGAGILPGTYTTPYIEPPGTKFYSDSGKMIINWPQQHYSNGVKKNASTSNRFKLIVRAVKRLKFYLIDRKVDAAKPIPSYLIECLLYNVPDDIFAGDSYTDNVKWSLLHCFNATTADAGCGAWEEVNCMKFLFGAGQPWTRQQAYDFVLAAWSYVENN